MSDNIIQDAIEALKERDRRIAELEATLLEIYHCTYLGDSIHELAGKTLYKSKPFKKSPT